MTESTDPVTTFAFEVLGMSSLIFGNAVGNRRSTRINEKCGAKFERREPAQYVDPNLKERDIYKLTRKAWLNLKN